MERMEIEFKAFLYGRRLRVMGSMCSSSIACDYCPLHHSAKVQDVGRDRSALLVISIEQSVHRHLLQPLFTQRSLSLFLSFSLSLSCPSSSSSSLSSSESKQQF